MKDAAIPYSRPSSPSDPQVLALFQGELARIATPRLAAAGPALWPRFVGYYQGLARLPRKVRRALQRRWRRPLAAIALLLVLGQAPALAAILTVAPGVPPAIAPDGACSLIEAIENANADPSRPHPNCAPGSGADTIVLPQSSYQRLTQIHNSTYGDNGLPVIASRITIEGNGSTIARPPFDAPSFRIFAVNDTGNLTLNETTVSGGYVRPENFGGGVYNKGTRPSRIAPYRSTAPMWAGGVFNNDDGTATFTNSTVSRNSAGQAHARVNNRGGGVSNRGTLHLTNSTVSGNDAYDGGGGGVYNLSSGTVTLTNSTVSDNRATGGSGGGVDNIGTATLTNSTISRNDANDGGGVSNLGTATVTNSTVSDNLADGGSGGGVDNGGTATLTNTTVSRNSARFGGGISGFLTLVRSLVSGNTATIGAEIYSSSGTENPVNFVNPGNFSFFGHSGLTTGQAFYGFTPAPTDRTATSTSTTPTALDAILDTTLANNGGPTETHALVAGGPAIDAAVTGCPPPATDQRGVSRPQGPACDIGAFERAVGFADLAVSLTDSPDPLTVNQTLAYTITVRNNGPSQATGVRLTDSLPQGVLLDSRPSQCTGTSSINCNLGTLAVGAEAIVTITVIPTVPVTVENTVRVVANEPDSNPANDSDTETTTVDSPSSARADLAITAAAAPDPGVSGQTLTYTLAVRNNGPATAAGVQVTDVLPEGVVLAFKPSECEGSTAVILQPRHAPERRGGHGGDRRRSHDGKGRHQWAQGHWNTNRSEPGERRVLGHDHRRASP